MKAKGFFKVFIVVIFIFTGLGIGALVLFPSPWGYNKTDTELQPRLIIPRTLSEVTGDFFDLMDPITLEDSMTAWAPLADGEVLVSVLTGYFGGGFTETQFIAYRNLMEIDGPIHLAFIAHDEETDSFRRVWSAPTAATRPGTVKLYTQDLLGDRSVCVLLSGMNSAGEHTLTVFRLNPQARGQAIHEHISKIADIRIDGNIIVREVQRSQAYHAGLGRGQSFNISAFGRDFDSTNILDQVEIIYAFNELSGIYEQTGMNRIPGSQVEQQRVRELLGNRAAFENFLSGLWYRVTPQGTIDRSQAIYFSPASREIVFFEDDTQRVFNWHNSNATRLGLHINSQNITINSLRRAVDIELESLESIRLRVIENIRLIRISSPWDGSFRRATLAESQERPSLTNAHISARYDGPMGRIHFHLDGSYMISSGDSIVEGHYAFFMINGREVLELRPTNGVASPRREIFIVESESTDVFPRRNLTLHTARIGARGVERLNERPLSLTLIGDHGAGTVDN